MEVSSMDELRQQISGEGGEKMRFALKIHKCLSLSKVDPPSSNVTGLCWCSDGVHFLCNTGLLAEFLGIKRNSVNTNLRSHGFIHQTLQLSAAVQSFPFLTDLRNWRECHHSGFLFSVKSTASDIERIPFVNVRASATVTAALPCVQTHQLKPANELPSSVLRIAGKSGNLHEMIVNLMKKLHFSQEDSQKVVENASFYWQAQFGAIAHANTQEVLSYIASHCSNMPEEKRRQMETNIFFLLCEEKSFSQGATEKVDFAQFLKFYIRFGKPSDACQNIEFFTDFSSYMGEEPSFKDWFKPGVSFNLCHSILSKKQWILRPSSVPGQFSLHKDNIVSRICYDCLDGFKVSIACEGGVAVKNTWNELLFDFLLLPNEEEKISAVSLVSFTPLDDERMDRTFSPIMSFSPFEVSSQVQFDSQQFV